MKPSFYLFQQRRPNEWVERYGIEFEDLEVGQVFEHRPARTFTLEEVIRDARRSLDLSPQWADLTFARTIAVPETQVLAATVAASTRTFGRVVANLGWTHVRCEPVWVGDTIWVESELLGLRPSNSRPDQGLLHLHTRARNQRGEWILEYQRKLLIYRRGHGPYQEAGYGG